MRIFYVFAILLSVTKIWIFPRNFARYDNITDQFSRPFHHWQLTHFPVFLFNLYSKIVVLQRGCHHARRLTKVHCLSLSPLKPDWSWLICLSNSCIDKYSFWILLLIACSYKFLILHYSFLGNDGIWFVWWVQIRLGQVWGNGRG